MNNIDKESSEIISRLISMNEADKSWIIDRLSNDQRKKILKMIDGIDRSYMINIGISADDDNKYQVSNLNSILEKSHTLNKDKLWLFLNNESTWVRAYLLGQCPSFFDTKIKDNLMRNKWNNMAGMESLKKLEITDYASSVINALLQARMEIIAHKNGINNKHFEAYMP